MTNPPFVILTPVYEDWEALRLLLPLIDETLSSASLSARVLIVDDGSITPCPKDLVQRELGSITDVSVLVLRRNLGHQRALCIGLCAIGEYPDWKSCEGVVVMDADGEDSSADIVRLVHRFRESDGRTAVFARRLRRSESLTFRLFYQLFRLLHRLLSGVPVQVGNFSLLPMSLLPRLTVVAELWNHYAAACVHSRLPITMVPTKRGQRLIGRSKMNFAGLVGHGLAAISVFGERIGARSLVAVVSIACALVLVGITAVGVYVMRGRALPTWSLMALAMSALLLMQALLLSLVFSFLTLSARSGGHFIPARDFAWFVNRIEKVWSSHEHV
jgi:polyisoprenyl-phosphate glycosyltransferase